MRRRPPLLTLILAFVVCAMTASLLYAVIATASPLKVYISDSQWIFVAKVEAMDKQRPSMILSVEDDLKGKAKFRKMPVLIKGDEDAIKLMHVPQLLKRLDTGVPLIVFVNEREKGNFTSFAYTNGTWMQIIAKEENDGRLVWNLTHGEPNLRSTFKGTTDELKGVVVEVLAGKRKSPPIDKNVPPGFGPELPAKSSSRGVGGPMFAVIPSFAIGGPIAILAILFPTVFGGVLILFRQWLAFITIFGINSTLAMIYDWKGDVILGESWWFRPGAQWMIYTTVIGIGAIWAWRRQLGNLAQGVDLLETPQRTENLILTAMSAAFVVWLGAMLWLKPPWGMFDYVALAASIGVWGATIYKGFRSLVFTELPMATEGIILGIMLVAHLCIGSKWIGAATAAAGNSSQSGEASAPKFNGERWRFKTENDKGAELTGIMVSTPIVSGNAVYAATAHTGFKYGNVYKIDLARGTKQWNYRGDDGKLKQMYSSLNLYDGKLYFGEGFHDDKDCKVYCIDMVTGQKKWTFQTTSQVEAMPIVAEGAVYVGGGNDGFYCLDANTGTQRWLFPGPNYKGRLLRFGSGAAFANGRVYAGTGVDRFHEPDPGETAVFCLDADTGKQRWKVALPLPCWSTPVVVGTRVYVAIGNGDVFEDVKEADKRAGAVWCLNADNGEVVWKFDAPNGILNQPVHDHHTLYFGCRDGNCYAISRQDGKLRWKVPLGGPVIATPALASRNDQTTSVFAVSSNGNIWCLDPATGKSYWNYDLTKAEYVCISTPRVIVTPRADSETRVILIGAGDVSGEHQATLLCLEDRVELK